MSVPSLNTLGLPLIFVSFQTKCSVSIGESFLKILRGQGYIQAFVQVDAQVTNEKTLDFSCSSSYETSNAKIIQPIIVTFARCLVEIPYFGVGHKGEGWRCGKAQVSILPTYSP